jgi:hypothetical protein
MSGKKINPAMRIKRRYLLIDSSEENVKDALLKGIGAIGWAKAAPIFLKEKNKLVLAVNRKELQNVRASLELSEKDIRVIKVSGTLKGLN